MMSKWKNRWKATVLRFARSPTAHQLLFCQLEPLKNLAFISLSNSPMSVEANLHSGHKALSSTLLCKMEFY